MCVYAVVCSKNLHSPVKLHITSPLCTLFYTLSCTQHCSPMVYLQSSGGMISWFITGVYNITHRGRNTDNHSKNGCTPVIDVLYSQHYVTSLAAQPGNPARLCQKGVGMVVQRLQGTVLVKQSLGTPVTTSKIRRLHVLTA